MYPLLQHRPNCNILVGIPKFGCDCDLQKRLDACQLLVHNRAPNASQPRVPNGTFRQFTIQR